MRKTSFWCVVVALLVVPARAGEPAKPVMPNNAMIVGWDGAHRDHIKKLLEEGRLPNLQKVIDQGTLKDIDVTSGKTDTKAGWSQILTGYRPEVTGVYNNGQYRDIPAGYSIFERLRAEFGADKIGTVAVIGKRSHCGEVNAPFKKPYDPSEQAAEKPAKKKDKNSQPRQPGAKKAGGKGHVVEEGGVKYLVFEGSPYYTMHHNVDQWHFGLMQDDTVGDKTLEMLDEYGKKPFFFFVHFAEVDHSGHKHGEQSKEYDDAIVSGDKQLGRIVEKLKQLGVCDKTLIYVTADHGFNVGAYGHSYAPYVFLATNDKKVMHDGTRADITPTILDRLGLDLSKIEPKLDGQPLTRLAVKPVEKALAHAAGAIEEGQRQSRRQTRPQSGETGRTRRKMNWTMYGGGHWSASGAAVVARSMAGKAKPEAKAATPLFSRRHRSSPGTIVIKTGDPP